MAKDRPARRKAALAAMPVALTQARHFGKARSVRAQTLLKDYVELIADLLETVGEARVIDIARRLGVSHVSVIRKIARLKLVGLVSRPPCRGVALTKTGKALAEEVKLRHRAVVDLLLAVGVPY
jgi:DtxR family transcriptional regulator, manganese transport regulator